MSEETEVRVEGILTYFIDATHNCQKLTVANLMTMLGNLPVNAELDGINLVGDRCDLFVSDFVVEYDAAKNIAFIGVR